MIVTALDRNGNNAFLRYAVRSTGGTWGAMNTIGLDNTQYSNGSPNGSYNLANYTQFYQSPMSVARDLAGPTLDVIKVVVAIAANPYAKTKIYGLEVNVSTAAAVSDKVIDSDALGSTRDYYRQVELFSTDNGKWVMAGIEGTNKDNMTFWVAKLDWNDYTIAPKSRLVNANWIIPNSFNNPNSTFWGNRVSSIHYLAGGKVVFMWAVRVSPTDGDAFGHVATVLSDTVSWGVNFKILDINAPLQASGGNNRNFSFARVGMWFRSDGADFYGLVSTFPPNGPTPTKPASGSLVATSLPEVAGTLSSSSLRVKNFFQIAEDSAFTTGLKEFEQDDSGFGLSGTGEMEVPSIHSLAQRLWYLRIKYRDELGALGFPGSSISFTVSHPPATATHSPTGSQVVAYGATNRFQWTFSDTSPGDTQTAYQVIVERNSDGLVVADTGKVASALNYADIALSVSYKGVVLRWKVRVWDSE
ncbi:MAG: hypothetical protein FJ267_11895, partial [Planctomycetes bacterium]|nr:hypothetical protein [Planctomycetota bacterium]